MPLFKSSSQSVSSKSLARLQGLIWVLIYGGLLTLVLGLSVQRSDPATGWALMAGGTAVAALGFVLIYLRSRLNDPA